MRIGFIGFGEAAYNIALGLSTEGLSNISAFDPMENDTIMGKIIKTNAKEANVELFPDAKTLASNVDMVIIAVPSTYSYEVCKEIKEVLHKDQLYVDVSASTPKVKNQVWEEIKDIGVLFVDAAMMGSLPKDKHKVPITASGNGALKFKDLMTPYNMDITTAGDNPGSASAIKLVRSIYMKGVAALMIEMLQAADKYSVVEDVVSSISKSMDNTPFEDHLDRLVTGSAIHCKRRSDELKGSMDMLDEANIHHTMTEASKVMLSSLVQYEFSKRFVDKKPTGWKEIIDILNDV